MLHVSLLAYLKRLSFTSYFIHICLMYFRPEGDSQRVETRWRDYILNFKYKVLLTYCAFGWLLCYSLVNDAWNNIIIIYISLLVV